MTWEGFQKELDKLTECGKLGEYMARDILNYSKTKLIGEDVVSDIDVDYLIVTCWFSDIYAYKTEISVQLKNGKTVLPWVKIEYYFDEIEASIGHDQWVEYITDESPTFFGSVPDKKIYGFTRGDN